MSKFENLTLLFDDGANLKIPPAMVQQFDVTAVCGMDREILFQWDGAYIVAQARTIDRLRMTLDTAGFGILRSEYEKPGHGRLGGLHGFIINEQLYLFQPGDMVADASGGRFNHALAVSLVDDALALVRLSL